MGIDRLCNAALAQPLRRPCISYVEGVFSSLQMSKHLRRRYSHMAAIISRVQGISKLCVTSCCAKATRLPPVQQSLRPIQLPRARYPGWTAECGKLPQICDERSPLAGARAGGGMGTPAAHAKPAWRGCRIRQGGQYVGRQEDFGHEGYQPRKPTPLPFRQAMGRPN
jgi:hypothetical protein